MKQSGRGRKRGLPGGEQGDAAATDSLRRRPGGAANMVSFCPQCGKRVEAAFNFCPFCGGKLPLPEEEPMQITPTSSLKDLNLKDKDQLQNSPMKKKVELVLSDKKKAASSVKANSPDSKSPKAKAKPSSRSPKKDKSAFLRPLPEGEILVDQNSRQQWVLGKLMIQSDRGVLYKAKSTCGSPEQSYYLKLDVKDGRLFHEQNFFQRAAKKASVEKWKKQHSVPLLGIPECLGFGLHNNYRFLVFSELGRSFQSVLDDCANKMSMKAALQLGVRLLDILEYLHENEYTLGDITAGSIYVNPANLAMVTLADYCFAYRYSPGGEHVSYREGSRTPHEGSLEFISVDSHKGVAPSRRSDLESLGYCLVKWLCDFLPWSADLTDPCVVMEQKERYKAEIIKHPELAFGWRTIPEALRNYLLQVLPLEYEEKPNYEELRALLRRPLELLRTSPYDPMDLKMVP